MGSVLLFFLLAPLLVAAVLVAITFPLARLVFPGGGSRGPHDTLASRLTGSALLWLMEWAASVWVVATVPFRMARYLPANRRPAQGRLPVILLPGVLENPLTLWPLRWRLARGLATPVFVLGHKNEFDRIENLVLQLRQFIDFVLAETGAEQVDIVGHSLGGMVGRSLVEAGNADQVRTVITLGSPHLGSAPARALPGKSMHQLRRGSAFLEKLNAGTLVKSVGLVGICSTHDNFVMPWSCALSPRGDNFILRYRGHLSLLFSTEVVGIIVRQLRDQDD